MICKKEKENESNELCNIREKIITQDDLQKIKGKRVMLGDDLQRREGKYSCQIRFCNDERRKMSHLSLQRREGKLVKLNEGLQQDCVENTIYKDYY